MILALLVLRNFWWLCHASQLRLPVKWRHPGGKLTDFKALYMSKVFSGNPQPCPRLCLLITLLSLSSFLICLTHAELGSSDLSCLLEVGCSVVLGALFWKRVLVRMEMKSFSRSLADTCGGFIPLASVCECVWCFLLTHLLGLSIKSSRHMGATVSTIFVSSTDSKDIHVLFSSLIGFT